MSEPAFARAMTIGQEAWPDLILAEPALRAFIAARVASDEELDKLAVADMYLACACIERVAGAVATFESHCLPSIDAALARMQANELADEVKQIVLDLLFVGKDGKGAIGTYSGRGNLRGWVRVIAVREALRLLRERKQRVPVGDDAMFAALAPTDRDDPELAHLKQHYREEFRRAFLSAVSALARRERTALRMHVLDGLSIDEIGAAFRAHRSTAARWLKRAREHLIEKTREELMRQLQITPSECDSVIRLVQSSLDVSLDTALKTTE